ncbi:MAG: hypothetical protein MZV65_28020 [Chromatiales bacterium]|nr:hypothetical protein [Chromatiales bacterium]
MTPFHYGTVQEMPVAVFQDGFGKRRPAQVGACGYGEIRAALLGAYALGWPGFVIVSHNFELLKPGSVLPDRLVVRRFQRLCHFLADHREWFETGSFVFDAVPVPTKELPRVNCCSTLARYAEQAWRRGIFRRSLEVIAF